MQNVKRVTNISYKNQSDYFANMRSNFSALTAASKILHKDLPKILAQKYQGGKNILHLTCEIGDANFLEEIMNLISIANLSPQAVHDLVNQEDDNFYRALYYALKNHSNFDIIEIMFKAGANIGYDEIYAILSCINESRHVISIDVMYQILVLIINKNNQYLTRDHISNISKLSTHPSVLRLISRVNGRIYKEQRLEYLYQTIVASYNAAKKNVASNKKVNDDLIVRVFDYFASNEKVSKEIVDLILSGAQPKLKSFINNLTSGFIDIMTTKTTTTTKAKKVGPKKVGLTKVTAVKKPAVKKPVAKKAVVKKAVAKKAIAKKTVAKKAIVKKAAVKKAVTKKPIVKKAVVKKAVAKKAVAKKTVAKKVAVKKAVKNTAKKASPKTLSQAVNKFITGHKSLINKTMGKAQLAQLASLLVGLLGDSKISGSLNKDNVQAIISAATDVAKSHVAHHKPASLKKRA